MRTSNITYDTIFYKVYDEFGVVKTELRDNSNYMGYIMANSLGMTVLTSPETTPPTRII